MECHSITTADEYNFTKVRETFLEAAPFEHDKETLILTSHGGHMFFFDFGCVVFWNIYEAERKDVLNRLKACELDPYKHPQEEIYKFKYGDTAKVFSDGITLTQDESLSLQLLAISYGLSQSVKLSVFEGRLMEMIQKMRHIPIQLAKKGKIGLRNREITKRMGELIMAKNTINIHSDMLDSPDFLWELPELEDLYRQTIKDQDLDPRVQVMNKRLDIIQDLFQVLGNELKNRHSFLLELIIVLLISIEVIISLSTHLFKGFF